MALHPGVIATKSGWVGQDEVVELVFDPRETSYEKLLSKALEEECAGALFPLNDGQAAIAKRVAAGRIRAVPKPSVREQESKYYLSRSAWRAIPMTGAQSAKVNALMDRPSEALKWLFPAQRGFAERLAKEDASKWPTALGVEFNAAWRALTAAISASK